MSNPTRHAATVLAALMLVAAGCGGNGNVDKVQPGAGLEDQRATVVSEFERAVEEARYLRDDIAAVRADMKAAREAASYEAERASKEAASLREEVAAIRREMEELSEAATSEVERTAEEAKRLREEIAAVRADMSAVREAAQGAESLTAEEIAGNLSEVDEYPKAVVIDDGRRNMPYSSRRRGQERVRVIYAPQFSQRQFAAQPRRFRGAAGRMGRPAIVKPHASQVDNATPAAPSTPNVSNTGPQAPNARPARPGTPNVSNTRPQAPNARPAASVARPARQPASVPRKTVHIPQPQR